MKLTRTEKEQLVAKISDQLTGSKAILLVNFTGLQVKEERDLKKKLREQGIDFEVIKNSLFKIALKKTGVEVADDLLNQPIALISAANDEVTPSKITVQFAKATEKLELIGGVVDQKFVDADFVKKLAALPSREELYAQLVGTLNAPMSRLVNALQGNLRSLVYILKQYTLSRQ